jgi:molybdopterin-guanine dinucleotide biosynthesis protein A
MPTNAASVVMGILVGGKAKRMGGLQKALLQPPHTQPADATLLAMLLRLGRAAGLEVVLLGQAELGPAAQGVLQLPDAEQGIGPLAALASLLTYAAQRHALAIACDMPYVTPALLERLLTEAPKATLLAPRDPATGKWQAMFARYHSPQVRPLLNATLSSGQRSFQQLFDRASATELALTISEQSQLRDWDTPEDMRS